MPPTVQTSAARYTLIAATPIVNPATAMPYDPDKHRRQSVRLPDYDYASAGGYFVTICTHGHVCLFGEIAEEEMHLNACGQIAYDEWRRTPAVRPNVRLDAFVVMPNHIHGVLIIVGDNFADGGDNRADESRNHDGGDRRGVLQYAPTTVGPTDGQSEPASRFRSPSQTLGAIIRGYKGAVTKRINQLRGTPGEAVWQRGFYDHVIRHEKDLARIRRYVDRNPARWYWDRLHPRAPNSK